MKEREYKYSPELRKAKNELFKYMEENNLSFDKDYSKDPIHGKKIALLLLKLNKERDKIMDQYPLSDVKNRLKLLTTKTRRIIMKKVKKAEGKETTSKKKDLKKIKEKVENKKAAEKKKGPRKVATKYDYPLVDGREMTAAEKKKYRMEQRKLAAGEASTSSKKPAKKATKDDVKKKVEKDKKVNKKKKAAKEED